MTAAGDFEAENIKLVERWIQSQQTGCFFASRLISREKKILVVEFASGSVAELNVEEINDQLDFAGSKGVFVVAIFPGLESLGEIERLDEEPRWRIESEAIGRREYVSLEWETKEGKWSNCMGLAPLLSMPPTRRAPFVGLALWAGNATHDANRSTVDFHDIPNPIKLEKRPEAFERVRRTVDELMGNRKDEVDWRKISFALPTPTNNPAS